jgi:hypothetical protein
MQRGGFPDDRTIVDLLGPVAPQYIDPLCKMWQIDRTWRVGDRVSRPLDLATFAQRLGMPIPEASALAQKISEIFRDAIRMDLQQDMPSGLQHVEFAGQQIGPEAEHWWRLNGR